MALNEDLIGFVRESLQRGLARDRIEQTLLQAGWPPDQVARAMHAFADLEFPVPVPRPATSASTRDAFLYVVMFTTLIVTACNLGNAVFALINRAFPDPAVERFVQPALQEIRWSVSSLIVAFPVFLYSAWLIGRRIAADPTKRAARIRLQLTYLTLFIAACTLIGDVTAVVYSFLGGELTTRFLLKVLTVAAIAGVVFGYYLTDLREVEKEPET